MHNGSKIDVFSIRNQYLLEHDPEKINWYHYGMWLEQELLEQLTGDGSMLKLYNIHDKLTDVKEPLKEWRCSEAYPKLLDKIMRDYSDLLRNKKYDACDIMIKSTDVWKIKHDEAISILTITFAFKELLKERDNFYKNTLEVISHDISEKEASDAMEGLE